MNISKIINFPFLLPNFFENKYNFQRYATWTAAPTAHATRANVVAIRVGQDHVVSNFLVIHGVKNTVNAATELVYVRKAGTDATAHCVSYPVSLIFSFKIPEPETPSYALHLG